MEKRLKAMIERAEALAATDVHLSAGAKPYFRTAKGMIEDVSESTWSVEDTAGVVKTILSEKQQDQLSNQKQLLTALSIQGQGRYRVNTSIQRGSFCLNIKMPRPIDIIESMEFYKTIEELHKVKSGLILLCGIAKSGKSTTAARILSNMNRIYSKSIVTLEHPIEYLLNHDKSIIKQKEIGLDIPDHLSGVMCAMAEDTDALYIDDISDPEVLDLAVRMAERGALVIGGLYTPDSRSTLDYLLDSYGERTMRRRLQIANVLRAVIGHKMIVMADEHLKPVYEVVLNASPVRRLILENKLDQLSNVVDAYGEMGMIRFDHYMERFVDEQCLSVEEAGMHAEEEKQVIRTKKAR